MVSVSNYRASGKCTVLGRGHHVGTLAPTAPSAQPETPPIDTALGLLAVCLLIAASAVFVAAEFALVAADRNRIEAEAEAGRRSARTALGLLKRLSFHLSGAQLGITLVSLVLGFIAEPIIAQILEPLLEPCLLYTSPSPR